MTDRDRLIELIKQATTSHLDYLESIDQKGLTDTEGKAKFIADYLLANGVIVQEQGEWIEDEYYDVPCVCSICGEEAQYISRFKETFEYDWEENLVPMGYEEIREYIKTPYCSRCGAKLKEREG